MSVFEKIATKRAAFMRENVRSPKHLILDWKSWAAVCNSTKWMRIQVPAPGEVTIYEGLVVSLVLGPHEPNEYIEVA